MIKTFQHCLLSINNEWSGFLSNHLARHTLRNLHRVLTASVSNLDRTHLFLPMRRLDTRPRAPTKLWRSSQHCVTHQISRDTQTCGSRQLPKTFIRRSYRVFSCKRVAATSLFRNTFSRKSNNNMSILVMPK